MKPIKTGEKLRPLVGLEISTVREAQMVMIRLQYLKYEGQKPFISDAYSLTAETLERLIQELQKTADQMRTSRAATPASKTH